MDLSELRALLNEPAPTPFDVDWLSVEAWLGTALPTAYKELGSTFGPWYVGDWVWVEVPCGDQPGYPGYSHWVRTCVRLARMIAQESEGAVRVPEFHPKRGGLLPWGESASTDRFFWDTTESDPERWPVVVYAVDLEPGCDPWVHTGLTMVDFLATLVTDGIEVSPTRRLGPLPVQARRTAYRADAVAWTPPPPPVRSTAPGSRIRALAEGHGMAALRDLVPPPDVPQLGTGTWQAVNDALGRRLPTAYVNLMNTYGGGIWRSYLRFPPPLDPSGRGLVAHAHSISDGYRFLRDDFPDSFPLAAWPEPGGLLAFADTIDGDVLGWLTVGEPDDWPLVVYPRHTDQGPPLATDLVDTLLTFMRGEPISDFETLESDDDPLEFATFVGWRQPNN